MSSVRSTTGGNLAGNGEGALDFGGMGGGGPIFGVGGNAFALGTGSGFVKGMRHKAKVK